MSKLNTVIELLRAMQADTPDDVLVVKEWLDGREVDAVWPGPAEAEVGVRRRLGQTVDTSK